MIPFLKTTSLKLFSGENLTLNFFTIVGIELYCWHAVACDEKREGHILVACANVR